MDSAWEGIFMLLILKIPLVYLAVVVWWAIRAEPVQDGGSELDGALLPLTPCSWDDWKQQRRRSTRGRRALRSSAAARARRTHAGAQ